jgi:hypothetical protein
MRPPLLQIAPVLHLTRITTAFATISNIWLVILWTRAHSQEQLAAPGTRLAETPLVLLLIGGAAAALGLYAFAVALNDILDVKRDRLLRPERPLASGQISERSAAIVVAVTLLVAILGATVFGVGGVLMMLLVAAAVLIYNAAGRFVPAIGLVLLGLVFAGAMVAPNIELRFIWPVWLVMTHVIAVGAATHVIGRRSPPLSRRAIGAVITGWVLSTLLLVGAGWLNSLSSDGLWPPWVGPWAPMLIGALVLGFVVVAARRVARLGPGQRAAEKVGRYGALWMSLYTVAWTLGQGLVGPAAILGGLTLAGFLGMTALREAYNLAEHPLGYRR